MESETASSERSERGAKSITMRSVESLIPYARNPRTHTDAQIAAIAKSIERFGFTNPILLNGESSIIAGHGRIAAAKLLGMSDVPCIDLNGLTVAEQRAYVIADNQLALAAGWDMRMLASELQELSQDGIDVSILGFSDAELANIEAVGANMDMDHWQGMPEFEQPNAMSFRDIIVHFKSQEDVDTFAALVGQKITEGLKFIWFPTEEPFPAKDFRYQTDDTPE